MALKKFKPTTSGQRFKVISTFDDITTNKPEKSLLISLKSSGGRNNTGKMTMRYMGGGHKRKLRIIDFKREKDGIPGVVKTIEYDPNRSARIALIFYTDGEKRYILAPKGLIVGQTINSGIGVTPDIGNTMFLSEIPLGSNIHNIELKPGKGAEIARSAGISAQLMSRDGKYAIIKMPSGETRMILLTCKATIGVVSNADHNLEISGKAGRSRWKGIRPSVRGSAMNPVDHPHGGGEGRQGIGLKNPKTPWGKPALGKKTRKKFKYSNRFIAKKRK